MGGIRVIVIMVPVPRSLLWGESNEDNEKN